MRELLWAVSDQFHDTKDDLEGWLFDSKAALYGAAACRIGIGVSVLLLLVGNFSTRQLWVGPASVWAEPVRAVSNFPELAVLNGASSLVVTAVYLFVLFSAAAFTVGWHTRVATIATLIGFVAITAQNPTVGNQSDNLIRLTLLWLLLIDCSEHWSLDSRRRAVKPGMSDDVSAMKSAWNSHETVPVWLSTSLHNIGVAGLMAQTLLIFLAAGFSKVADVAWQHGTALYSTMQLPDYRPFPLLSDLFSHNRVLLALITYAIMLSQLFFAPFLLNTVTRRIVIALAIVVNVFFAIVMALPVSSVAIIAVTLLFVSSATYVNLAEWLGDVCMPLNFWLADRWDGIQDWREDVWEKVRERVANRS